MPDVAPVATKAAELDIVPVRAAPMLEHENKLVSAAVERTHPAIVFDPDAEIFQLAIDIAGGCQQFANMAPIHEQIAQRTIAAERHEVSTRLAKKGRELCPVHLARGHREWPMMGRAQAARVAIDRDVVRRV